MRVRGLKHPHRIRVGVRLQVAPHAGAWIETQQIKFRLRQLLVAPHAGAWIETHPELSENEGSKVAPHAGAWIETIHSKSPRLLEKVAPHAGAWIETLAASNVAQKFSSHPMRVRGLKLRQPYRLVA